MGWSALFSQRFAGQPLKGVAIDFEGRRQLGECVVTTTGVEGSLIYTFSAALRDAVARDGQASFALDLMPARSLDWVTQAVSYTHLDVYKRQDRDRRGRRRHPCRHDL